MCWNAETSIISFVIGLISCIVIGLVAMKQKKTSLAILSFGWIWVIFMQFWEFFLWKYPAPSNVNNTITRFAFVFNITQTVLLGFLFLIAFKQPSYYSIPIAILLFYFICHVFYFSPKLTTTGTSCDHHVSYGWWSQIPAGGWLYMATLIVVFLCLVRPFVWSLSTLIYILILFALSMIFYYNSVASMWCFFAVSVPIVSWVISLISY